MTWVSKYMDLAKWVASEWSKDPSTQVGAVAFRPPGDFVSLGYNGFARGVTDSPSRLDDRNTRLKLTIHAEKNAILTAGRNGTPLQGCHMVTTHHPCSQCASAIVQAGIERVYYVRWQELETRWSEDMELARNIFWEGGVDFREYTE